VFSKVGTDVAWCHDHGYANYATKDGFCVGAGGKLFKIGEAPSPRLVRGRLTAVMLEFGAKSRGPTS